jgi:hypothetical protein
MSMRMTTGRLLTPLAVGVAVVALAGGFSRMHAAAAKPHAAGQPSKHRVAVAHAVAAPHPEPSYLPPGATRTFAGPHPRFGGTWIYSYSLPGPANAGSGLIPVTNLEVIETPASTAQPPPADQYYGEQQVDIAGHIGSLSFPRNDYGIFRVDWTDGSKVYTVMVNRGDTGASGVSGVSADELLKVARSMGT